MSRSRIAAEDIRTGDYRATFFAGCRPLDSPTTTTTAAGGRARERANKRARAGQHKIKSSREEPVGEACANAPGRARRDMRAGIKNRCSEFLRIYTPSAPFELRLTPLVPRLLLRIALAIHFACSIF